MSNDNNQYLVPDGYELPDPTRELDARIAYLLGWRWDKNSAWSPSGSKWSRVAHEYADWSWLPIYSKDIAAAWQVVNFLADSTSISLYILFYGTSATLHLKSGPNLHVVADSTALAICHLAIKWAQN
jgi:Phage ABA sandwich domain